MTGPRPMSFMRQFAHTQGRVRAGGVDFPLDVLVRTTSVGSAAAGTLARVRRLVIEAAQAPISVAEAAARAHVHLGVARVLVADMVADGLLVMSEATTAEGPDLVTLQRLLSDLNSY